MKDEIELLSEIEIDQISGSEGQSQVAAGDVYPEVDNDPPVPPA